MNRIGRGRGGIGPAEMSAVCAIVLAAALLAAGCMIPGIGGGSEVRETVDRTVDAAGVTALELQAVVGTVEVRQWAEPQVAIRATKRSRFGQAELDRVSVSVTEGPTLVVRSVHPTPAARVAVDYAVMVPAGVGSIAVETSNGRVLVEGVRARVSARTSNGAVRVAGAGDVEVETSNGGVEIRDANGTATARTSNGAIEVANVTALGDLETSNGRLTAEVRAVREDVTLRTSNGNVALALGPGLGAAIDAETSSGRIRLPDGLLRVEEQSANRLRATAGAGGETITVRTSNGEIAFSALS